MTGTVRTLWERSKYASSLLPIAIPTFLVAPEVVWPDQMVGVGRALAARLQGTERGQGGGGRKGGKAGWRGRETRPGDRARNLLVLIVDRC